MNRSKKEIYCVLDANLNRAKEAIRVIEDINRFILKNKKTTDTLKTCRHSLTSGFMKFPLSYRNLLAARNSRDDIGKKSLIRDKSSKLNTEDLLISNFKRSQESLRVIEEFSKIIAPQQTKHFQSTRFKLYDLEKHCLSKI